MTLGFLFLILGLGMSYVAAHDGDMAWLLLWPALSFSLVGLSYLFPRRLGASLFGKRASGSLSPVSILLLLPYLLYAWAVWHLVRLLGSTACYNQVAPGIYLGRRPFASELPADVVTIVDLTSEFPVARKLTVGRTYLVLPTLDHYIPSEQSFLQLVREVAGLQGPVYIHCAAGKGRSAMFAAALLVTRGLAPNMSAAESQIRLSRPSIRLSGPQHSFARRIETQLHTTPSST